VIPLSLFWSMIHNRTFTSWLIALVGTLQISLLALSLWSFHFASLGSFGLLAYVGYILYAFPSMFRLHHINGMLLVFILFWAASTYIFNVVLTFSSNKSWKVHFARGFEISYNYIKEYFVDILYNSIAGYGNMGNYRLVALPYPRILLASSILSWFSFCFV